MTRVDFRGRRAETRRLAIPSILNSDYDEYSTYQGDAEGEKEGSRPRTFLEKCERHDEVSDTDGNLSIGYKFFEWEGFGGL